MRGKISYMSITNTMVKHAGGRPVLWKSAEQLEAGIKECQKWCEEKGKSFTLSRLAVFLGCDRQTLANYAVKDEFFGAIQKARQLAEATIEEKMMDSKTQVVGAIFIAKNNFGWKDRSEVDHTHTFDMSAVMGQIEGESADVAKPPNFIEGEIA